MAEWRRRLKYDPLPRLLASGNEALRYFVQRDLLGEKVGPVRRLWQLPEAQRILKKQQSDGSWRRSGAPKHAAINYGLIETWRQFRFLVEQYGFTRKHPQAQRAAEFLFSCQTRQGDFRGMLADQYATYYSGAIMALLIQAGYAADARIERGFRWLLSMRQDDHGWTIPILTYDLDRATQYRLTSRHAQPLEPDRSMPFSHNWTGMVLRAFAVHPIYRRSRDARQAGRLLRSRFFEPDTYTSYKAASYWVRFDFPFWWNNLLTAVDSLSLIGVPADDPDMQHALEWFVENQGKDGLWKLSYAQPRRAESAAARARDTRLWVSFAICRVFKRLLG